MANQQNFDRDANSGSMTFDSLKEKFLNGQFGWKHILSAATVLGGIGAASRYAIRRGKKTVKANGNGQQKKAKAGRKSSNKRSTRANA